MSRNQEPVFIRLFREVMKEEWMSAQTNRIYNFTNNVAFVPFLEHNIYD